MTEQADRSPTDASRPEARSEDRPQDTVHVINHTHWDREWFLTHEYTTAWIPDLIDSLTALGADNEHYEYLFDGQTLVIEDLLLGRPEYRSQVEELITKQTLHIGPLYSQPDWRMLSGQLHVRNLTYGTDDAAELGGEANVAWLVDTFGHISQAPQLLSLVGVDAAFVWRGVPEMHPVFLWQGANGAQVPTVNLFGGYRNLYGITKTAEIAVHRLVAETNKLSPYYGDVPIPLFDGYDLDTQPEDPARYYQSIGIPPDIALHASSPRRYMDAVVGDGQVGDGDDHPVIDGELISGRYGSTFPGTLSARTYLKVLHSDAEHAFHLLAEPLAVLANARGREYPAATYERASRDLLQNGVHDCICGVSVDQVHERMDRSYRSLLDAAVEDAQASIDTVMAGFATGSYALSTTAMRTSTVQRTEDHAVVVTTAGIGVTPVTARHRITTVEEPADGLTWSNDHYSATVASDGVTVDGGRLATLVVRAEDGDTYSSEPGPVLGVCTPTAPPVIESRSDVDVAVRFNTELRTEDLRVSATVIARFDHSPVIDFTIELDSDGTGFRADLEFATGVETDTVLAGMPFDVVERPHVDINLLPTDVEPELAAVLMGQREVERVDEFPFQGFVALRNDDRTSAVLARGIRSYRSTQSGTLSVALRRSVEWLAKSGLVYRQGDAGPAMYVPGARSERTITHRVGYAVLTHHTDTRESEMSDAEAQPAADATTELLRINEGFQNPPVLVDVQGTGSAQSWQVFAEELPTAGFELIDQTPVIRLFNPADHSVGLSQQRDRVSVRGADLGTVAMAGPKEILSLGVALDPPKAERTPTGLTTIEAHGLPSVRVGVSRSRPDQAVMAELADHRRSLQQQMAEVTALLETAEGPELYRLTHREVVLAREEAEVALSLELNRRLADSDAIVSIPDDPDPEIARLGSHLNDLRVKRRIYDYVVQSMA